MPVHGLDGYLAQQLAIELLRARMWAFAARSAGLLNLTRARSLKLAGDAAIEELKANSTAASTPMTEGMARSCWPGRA